MRIGFLMVAAEYTHSSPVTFDIMQNLRNRGIDVVAITPEEQLINLASIEVTCDLYVLRPSAEIILSLAGILYNKGAYIINNYPACAVVRDKVQVACRLLQAGLPFPDSYVTGDIRALHQQLQSSLIIKPERGSLGEGIRIVNQHDEAPAKRKGGFFAQEFLANDRFDLKVYVVGDEVYARKRISPCEENFNFSGTDSVVTDEIRQLALSVGELFDLEIYGLDIIQTSSGPYIVDVNYFPSFLDVPDISEKLADYIHRRALQIIPKQSKLTRC